MVLKKLLLHAKVQNASDIHLTVGQPPIIRVHGHLRKTDNAMLLVQDIEKYKDSILTKEQDEQLQLQGTVDLGKDFENIGRFRINIFKAMHGFGIAMRVIPTELKSMEELGLPSVLDTVVLMEKGLILVTGPTGSGKSTTLAAMVDKINRDCAKHIVTIEDPIEFVHQHKNCLVHQREVGVHAQSFNDALRSAFREDPDVILIGEMRDLETISMAITAAETGHVVFGTLHTIGAPQTINRIIDAFPTDQQQQIRIQLTEVLEMVLSQILVPTKNMDSRVVATELMFGIPAIRNLIREGKTHQIPTVIQTNLSSGMHDLAYSLKVLRDQGVITDDEVLKKTGVANSKK